MPNLPKPADKRARRNAGGPEFRSVKLEPAPQPELPEDARAWCPQTRQWWEALGSTPLADDFTAPDWEVLLIAAVVHNDVWAKGQTTRVDQFMSILGRFPFTPRDRQALRIQSLTGDELEEKVSDRRQSKAADTAKKAYGDLRAVV